MQELYWKFKFQLPDKLWYSQMNQLASFPQANIWTRHHFKLKNSNSKVCNKVQNMIKGF